MQINMITCMIIRKHIHSYVHISRIYSKKHTNTGTYMHIPMATAVLECLQVLTFSCSRTHIHTHIHIHTVVHSVWGRDKPMCRLTALIALIDSQTADSCAITSKQTYRNLFMLTYICTYIPTYMHSICCHDLYAAARCSVKQLTFVRAHFGVNTANLWQTYKRMHI